MRVRLIAVLAAAFVLVGCGNQSGPEVQAVPEGVGPAQADPVISVGDNYFADDQVVIKRGTTVTWVWEGRAVHDVRGPGFHSDIKSAGEFSREFAAPGAYPYVCSLHPGMAGVIYVLEGR